MVEAEEAGDVAVGDEVDLLAEEDELRLESQRRMWIRKK